MRQIFISFLLVVSFFSGTLFASSVANLKGGASVEQGTMHYSIEILTPPGIAGVEPKLSFEYNQNGGNGIMGKGWSIGGLSAISRCGSTVAQDKKNRGVRFNKEDNYCLNGQRLIAVQGRKGEEGTEYRTEIDSFSKIISYGSGRNGPDHFVVYTKSGDIYEYGATRNSQVTTSNGTPFMWLVNKISDRLENRNDIKFSYNSEKAIQTISYANSHNKIVFNYNTDRSDQKLIYIGGKAFSYKKKLESVKIYAYDKNIRTYNMRYQMGAHDGLKLLQIQECDRGECLKPIKFTYGSHATSQSNDTFSTYGIKSTKHIFNADFNNDGISDLYILDGYGSTDMIKLGSRDGNFQKGTINTHLNLGSNLLFADINGDGYTDILEIHRKYIGYRQGNGKGRFGTEKNIASIAAHSNEVRLGDFDGDGKVDILCKVRNTVRRMKSYEYFYRYYLITPLNKRIFEVSLGAPKRYSMTGIAASYSGYDGLGVADINNDGLTDIIKNDEIWLNQGRKNFVRIQNIDSKGNIFYRSRLKDIKFVDFNRDGYLDIYATYYKKDDAIWLNDGTGHFKKQDFPVNYGKYEGDLVFADFDQDGYTDIYDQRSKELWINQANWTNGWEEKFQLSDTFYANIGKKNLLFGDFNGDGAIDILDAHGEVMWFNALHREFLSSITDSFGNKTEITYKPLTDSSIYSRNTSGHYYGSSAYVVSQIKTSHSGKIV